MSVYSYPESAGRMWRRARLSILCRGGSAMQGSTIASHTLRAAAGVAVSREATAWPDVHLTRSGAAFGSRREIHSSVKVQILREEAAFPLLYHLQ